MQEPKITRFYHEITSHNFDETPFPVAHGVPIVVYDALVAPHERILHLVTAPAMLVDIKLLEKLSDISGKNQRELLMQASKNVKIEMCMSMTFPSVRTFGCVD